MTRTLLCKATLALAFSFVLAYPLTWHVSAGSLPRDPAVVMRDAGFSETQIASVEAGGIATRILRQSADNAVFVTGVVRIDAPVEALADGVRRIEALRSGGRMLQIGRFGTPPTIEDLEPLVLANRELDDLRGCRVGDCDIKIDRPTMDQAQAIDWSAADSRDRALRLTKAMLLGHLQAYVERGSSAMAIYEDNDQPESVASAFEQILRDSPRLVRSDPPFYGYLLDFPGAAPLPNVENLFYWSKEKLRKPVVSVVHVCMQRKDDGGQASYCIAMKHIYDSHYFLGHAEFLEAIPEAGRARSFYFVRSIRALIDPPRGWLRSLLLGQIKGAMRDQLAKDMRRTKSRLESLPTPVAPGIGSLTERRGPGQEARR